MVNTLHCRQSKNLFDGSEIVHEYVLHRLLFFYSALCLCRYSDIDPVAVNPKLVQIFAWLFESFVTFPRCIATLVVLSSSRASHLKSAGSFRPRPIVLAVSIL